MVSWRLILIRIKFLLSWFRILIFPHNEKVDPIIMELKVKLEEKAGEEANEVEEAVEEVKLGVQV